MELAADNEIKVKLRSKPGTYLTIEITQAPPSVDFSISPESIAEGDYASLLWQVEFADKVVIDNGIGQVHLSGSLLVSPPVTTTYTITASNVGDTVTQSKTLTVIPRPVASITAEPLTIIEGDSSRLSWNCSNADTAEIDNGIGEVPLEGSVSVSPAVTTEYTITASGPGGTAESSVTVTVIPRPVVNITADPERIDYGSSSIISWTSEHADSVVIDQGIGQVDPNGSLAVFPKQDTTYTITATGPGGTATASVTVIVINPPPRLTMVADPTTVEAGESFILTWSTEYAESVTGTQQNDNGSQTEDIPLNGSTTIHPDETTVYTITATGPGGTTSKSVTVTVNFPAPLVSLSADPVEIYAGSPTILEWNTDYADECQIDPGIGSVALSGKLEIFPQETTTYLIHAQGPGGVSEQSVTVQVKPLPPYASISVEPARISPGQVATISWETTLADSCEISPAIGPVDPRGTLEVSPATTTTYTITATGDGGTTTKEAVIIVSDVDLLPGSMDLSNSEVDPQSLEISGTINVEVTNSGTTPVNGSFAVTLFEDMNNNAILDETDQILGQSIAVNEPAPDQTILVGIPVSGRLTFLDKSIFVLVDSAGDIEENNEANNISNSMADCQYIPPVGSFDPILEWEWSQSPECPDHYQVTAIPVVANLNDDNNDGQINNDDIPDIIFSSYEGSNFLSNGRLRAISGDGSGELFVISDYDVHPSASPAVGDIDNDGLVEILEVTNDLKVIAFENDGTFKWISDSSFNYTPVYDYRNDRYKMLASISLADLNHDGYSEIIVGRAVYNSDGSTLWKGQRGYGFYNSCVADIDLDGSPEVIAGNTAYRATGEVYWENQNIPSGFSAVGNLDDDPYPEIVVCGERRLAVLEHNGELKWKADTFYGKDRGGPPTIADFDNDGLREISVAGKYYYFVCEPDGSLKWRIPIEETSSGVTGSSVFDFEGDGSAEVVYADEEYLRILRGTDGAELFKVRMGSRTRLEYPVIADVDNDNNAEIVVVTNNDEIPGEYHGIKVFGDANDTWVNTRKIWNQHTYHITNINDDGTIPRHEANNWETYNNYRQNEMQNPHGCTDLSASMIRVNRESLPSAVVLIARVGNCGVLHVAPGVYVSFYLGDPDAGGTLIGTTRTGSRLYPGEYEDVTLQWENPAIDVYDIFARVDDNGSGSGGISESNETNNTTAATVNLGNQAPVADAGPDQVVLVSSIVRVSGDGSSDPEGAPVTYSWSISSMPPGSLAELDDPHLPDPSFVADVPGEYILQLVVNDGMLDSGIDTVTISAREPVTVPNVVLLELDTAREALTSSGLVVGTQEENYSDDIPVNRVLSQEPLAGEVVPAGSPVNLVISNGVRMVYVPDLSGMTLDEATNAVEEASLVLGQVEQEYIDIRPEGQVFYQSVAPGESVAHDTAIDLKISLGPFSGTDTTPPYAWIHVDPATAQMGYPVDITVTAADNVAVASVSLEVNGQALLLEQGRAVFVPQAGGFFTATATAVDSAGLSSTAEAVFSVVNPYDHIPPEVMLDEEDCPDVFDLYSVMGWVYDSGGVSYTLSARRQGETDWMVFAQGTGTEISGELGVLDPSLLRNGVYEIRLAATDLAGNVSEAFGCLLVDGQLKAGQVALSSADAQIPAPGIPLVFEREYDSRSPDGDFGPGWNLSASGAKPMTTRELDAGWGQEVRGTFAPTYYLVEKYRHVVVIRFSDQEVIKFKIDVTPKSSFLLPVSDLNLQAHYLPLDQTQGSLEALDVSSSNLMLVGDRLMQWGTDPYQPVRFRYTKPDGTTYILNTETGIESITDIYGNSITYTSSSITASSGVSISIERGAGDRIERITDPLGRTVEYHYDARGMLEKVVQTGPEPELFRTLARYGYTAGLFGASKLEDIVAPDGTVLGRFEYDAQGRMTALIDAQGNRIIYGFDVPSHKSGITDRLGRTTLYEFNSKGFVTRKTDPMGNVTTWTYDQYGNKLSETDPLGNTTTWTYDASGNMLSETDPLGNTTSYTYNERNQLLSRTDPNGNTTTYAYDEFGNKVSETDPLGNTTTYSYDEHGNLVEKTDPLGNVTRYAYDDAGNKIREDAPGGRTTTWTYDLYGNELSKTVFRTTPSGRVAMTTTHEYDSMNHKIRTIDPLGYETTYEYDFLGRKIAETDKNGARTEFEYDANGNQTAIHYADGTSLLTSYDAEGNRVSTTDRAGRTTFFEYDAENRLTRVTYPDGSATEMVYDAAGRLTATIDENGNQTIFAYDAAGRRISLTDPLGNTVRFSYDAAGNQVSTTDPSGAVTRYVYDAANRKTETIYPDNTNSFVAYDALGRKVAETDQAGHTTFFVYDAADNLVSVTDALGNVTLYTYDEAGNRLSHTDPNGNTETWEYDHLGRVVSHTLPLGMTETFTYDGMGNMLAHTDFNGNTITYEYSPCCGRLTRKVFPDNSTVEYTYLGDGKRESVTDARGTTLYSYDERGRPAAVTYPGGDTISYTYDPRGNRTSVTTPSGTTTYTYDAANRLTSVTDPSGRTTTYTYDANGNRASVTYPNGTTAHYTYDSLNRLAYLENRKADGEVISSYFYTLGPAGNRLNVAEHNGRVVNYTYDALYRLTREEIIDPENGNETIEYTYDAKGNRLTKTDNNGTTSYTYDANDRLVSEAGPGYTRTYTYDANGNTITRTAGQDSVSYRYDYENRLIHATTMASEISYAYDVDGIRVAKTVDGESTHFLVDKNRKYAQVLEERDNLDSLTASYVYGDDLISQDRAGTISYYHYDGLGSTRALTDDSGTVTDTYTYEAFGSLIYSTGSTQNRYLFTGEQYDPNAGFYYLRARYYDPKMGRFLTTDAFEGKLFEPISLHKYMYANMNPVMFVDPTGEMTIGNVITVLSVVSNLNKIAYRSVEEPNYLRRHLYCSMKANRILWNCMINVFYSYGGVESIMIAVCAIGCKYKTFGLETKTCINICWSIATAVVSTSGLLSIRECFYKSKKFMNDCMGDAEE